jgi:hypothetical protein
LEHDIESAMAESLSNIATLTVTGFIVMLTCTVVFLLAGDRDWIDHICSIESWPNLLRGLDVLSAAARTLMGTPEPEDYVQVRSAITNVSPLVWRDSAGAAISQDDIVSPADWLDERRSPGLVYNLIGPTPVEEIDEKDPSTVNQGVSSQSQKPPMGHLGLLIEEVPDVKEDYPDSDPDPNWYKVPRCARVLKKMTPGEVANPIKWFRTMEWGDDTYRLYDSNVLIPFHLQSVWVRMDDTGLNVNGPPGGAALVYVAIADGTFNWSPESDEVVAEHRLMNPSEYADDSHDENDHWGDTDSDSSDSNDDSKHDSDESKGTPIPHSTSNTNPKLNNLLPTDKHSLTVDLPAGMEHTGVTMSETMPLLPVTNAERGLTVMGRPSSYTLAQH